MRKKVAKRDLITSFLNLLASYDYRAEYAILGLGPGDKKSRREFTDYFKPLIITLWAQALGYAHPDFAKPVLMSFMDRFYQSLIEAGAKSDFPRIRDQINSFFTISEQDNGIVVIAVYCVELVTTDKARKGERTIKLTEKIIGLLKHFIDALNSIDIVSEDKDYALFDKLVPHDKIPAKPVQEFTARPEPGAGILNVAVEASPAPVREVEAATLDPANYYDESVPVHLVSREEEPEIPAASRGDHRTSLIKQVEDKTLDLDGFKIVTDDERRVETRIPCVNIQILQEDTLREFPVQDISAGGIGIRHEGWRFEPNQLLTFDIFDGYRTLFKGVRARVVRCDGNMVGCAIENLSSEQKDLLCRLIMR